VPGMMAAMTYRDTVYGLPLNYKSIAMIYNTALVKAPPRTSGELIKLAKSLTDKSTGRFGLAYEYSNFFFHAALMNAFGGGAFDATGKPILNCDANVKSVELLTKWVDKDGFLPAEPSTALVTTLFNEGRAAMVFNGPWFLGEIAPGVEYALATLPTVDEAGGKPMRPWMTVEGVYITAGSKDKEAAYDVVKYVNNDPKVGADPVIKVFRQQVEVAVPMPNLAEMSMMWTPATSAMTAIVQKSSSPKAALDQAQKELEASVAMLRKKS